MATQLIELLESFNRKERFFLIGSALGNPAFRLGRAFRTLLGEAFRLPVPADAFVAMDYHFDWLQVSLFLAQEAADEAAVHSNAARLVRGNQEDVDLLVAFAAGETTHLMLLEAKAATSWTNKQMRSKADRLTRIFGDDGRRYPHVQPHVALLSPRPPQQLRTETWPGWMTPEGDAIWLPLRVPGGRRTVMRCDARGKRAAAGGSFRVRQARRGGTVGETDPGAGRAGR